MFTRNRAAAILFIITLLPLLVHAVGGTGSRYFTDDYCIWMEAHDAEPLALTWTWYQTSGGRLAQYLGMALLFRVGADAAPVLPALLLIVWGVGLGWLGIEVARALRLPMVIGLVGGLFVEAAIIAAAPNFVQAVYWMTGILTYPIPAVTATFATALMVRVARRSTIRLQHGVAVFVLMITSALFNEPFAFMQAALIGAALLIAIVTARQRRSLWQILTVAAAATLIGLIVLVAAPGNSVRQASFEAEQSLFTALVESLVYAVTFSLAAVVFNAFGTVAAFFSGMAVPGLLKRWPEASDRPLVPLTRRQSRVGLIVVVVLWIGACAAFMLPGFFATSNPPPARSFIMPLWAYLPWCVVLGALVRSSIRIPERSASGFDTWIRYTAAAAIAAHGLWAAAQAAPTAAYALAFGPEWDARALELAAVDPAGDVQWTPLPHDLATYAGLESIGADSDHWVNRCAADYFGVAALMSGDSPSAAPGEGG